MSSIQLEDIYADAARASRVDDIPGCWPGRVESTDDPKRIDRVRVRVIAFHGTKDDTPTKALPWASVMSLNGGGLDYGSSGQQYPVGSNVWVMFALGKLEHPVVMGGYRCDRRVPDGINDGHLLTLDGVSDSGADTTWSPDEDESEHPKDVFEDSYQGDNHPTITVWQKSFKGHTILVEDRDGFEFLQIIDRAGQVIEMNCPVTETANEGNSEQRGSRSAIRDNQVDQGNLVGGRAFIRLKDIAGQEILLDGRSGNEQIKLLSRNRLGTAEQRLILSSGKGKEGIELVDKQGTRIKLDPNGTVPIILEDYAGNKIEFDADAGTIRVGSAAASEETVTSNKDVTVGGYLKEIIGGDHNVKVVGKRQINVVSDFSGSVGGLSSLALTGPAQVQIANTQLPAGVPAATGFALEVILGNVELVCTVGSQTLKAPLGINLEGSTSGESMALGDTLASALQELNDVFVNNAANFGIGNMGAPVPINPAVVSALTAWAIKYITTPATNIVSQLHKVSRL